MPTQAQLDKILPHAVVPFVTCEECQHFSEPSPLVSTICLAYDLPNRQTVLEEAVESFIRQTYPLKELVIVNDTPGLVIECDSPGVRVVNVEPCKTLGDKYNAGISEARGSLICSWDDDDISLPWRMSLSVELLGSAEYFNPKSYWYLCGDTLQHEVKTGYAHNASMFRKTAWAKVGGYQPLEDNSQDAKMDAALQLNCKTVIGSGAIEQTAYIYRWGDGLHHGSYGMGPASQPGTFKLNPHWRQNYENLTTIARTMPMDLFNRFRAAATTPSDINEHCETLRTLASQCKTVVECGTRGGVSTTALLAGQPERLITVDVNRCELTLPTGATELEVRQSSSLELEPIPCDLLFIDTLHTKAQLSAELARHAGACSRWIVMHDTAAFGERGEDDGEGIQPAIAEFLKAYPEWVVMSRTDANNGLTVLSRCESDRPSKTHDGPALTIGMASYRDAGRTTMTIMSLLLGNPDVRRDEFEIVVIDNDPQGQPDAAEGENHSKTLKLFSGQNGTVYDHFTTVQGTAAAKGRIFEIAKGRSVLVIDCHVILPAGTLRKLIDYFAAHPDSKDLLQGPLIADGLGNAGDHFKQAWGSWMLGQWATKDSAEPFEIESQGCGLFACNKAAWPGFHSLLRGFGPEEGHLHNRIRRNGGKCWSMPWLKWWHGFSNPGGERSGGLGADERLRGYLVTSFDTGKPTVEEIRKHYVEEMGVAPTLFGSVLASTKAEMGISTEWRFGDQVESALTLFGITKERVQRFTGSCNCQARRDKLNQLSAAVQRWWTGGRKTEDQRAVETLIGN